MGLGVFESGIRLHVGCGRCLVTCVALVVGLSAGAEGVEGEVSVTSQTKATFPDVTVDATTLTGKTVVGYQGWFYAPGDGNPSSIGWRHWSRESGDAPGGTDIGPGLYTVEMWPDVSEYDADELFDAPNVVLQDTTQGKLFSSISPKTVARHFQWMKEHGIDGAFLQRFVSELADSRFFAIRNTILENVQAGANTHGRIFSLEYDTSGTDPATMYEEITDDWKYLVDIYDIANDPSYLHHNGKPVVTVWGLGFVGRGHTPALATQIIDFFKNDASYGGNYVIGGVPTFWRTLSEDSETDSGWGPVYLSWDAISPWMVGRFVDGAGVDSFKAGIWAGDITATQNAGIDYLPVVWPGFSWDNLQGYPAGTSLIPRRGGDFLWEQIYAFQDLGVNSMFVAMFDEVDEATAIFKTSDNYPTTDHWIGLEGKPSDWYLNLTGAANLMLRGEIPLSPEIPITLDPDNVYTDFLTTLPGFGSPTLPFGMLQDAIDDANSGATIHIEPGNSSETFTAGSSLSKAMTLLNSTPLEGTVTIGAP